MIVFHCWWQLSRKTFFSGFIKVNSLVKLKKKLCWLGKEKTGTRNYCITICLDQILFIKIVLLSMLWKKSSFQTIRFFKEKLFVMFVTCSSHCVKSVQIRSFSWFVFCCVRTEYRKIRTRKSSALVHFSCSEYFQYLSLLLFFLMVPSCGRKNLRTKQPS